MNVLNNDCVFILATYESLIERERESESHRQRDLFHGNAIILTK